jgi:hypothetical protein
MEPWASLLISECVSWCPRFRAGGSLFSAGPSGAEEPREACDGWQSSLLIGVAGSQTMLGLRDEEKMLFEMCSG